MPNILTIDLEDWYMEAPVRRWRSFPDRVEPDTEALLELLARHGARATFFVLGCLAERHPGLVKRVAQCGHEIALHGLWHDMVYEKTPARFGEELRRARALVEQAAGTHVRGFRAPYFSIIRRSLWALPIIASCGLTYDSSIFPTWHFRYGIPGWRRFPHRIDLSRFGGSGTLLEIPISTVRLAGLHLPFSGGAYLRLLPYRLVCRAIRSLNAQGHPAVVYLHPWELDPEQPHMGGAALFRLRHYVGLRRVRKKLERMLHDFQFTTVGDFTSRFPLRPAEQCPS
jgi:polysaccharide deacetylase family protein (PEP-CTERM system associated)